MNTVPSSPMPSLPPRSGDARLLETLRAKAMLLIQREREVHELREGRDRVQQWHEAFHSLALDIYGETPDLMRRWAELVVKKLSFAAAAVLEIDDATGEVVLSLGDPAGPPRAMRVPPELLELLRDEPSGIYGGGEAPASAAASKAFASFAAELDLATFLWFSFVGYGGTRWLLLAGAPARSAAYQRVAAHDRGHFVMLGSHVAALLANRALLAEVKRESRRAGMADVATGVLHNVGNVLTSVNVSVEVLAERLGKSRLAGLGKLSAMLEAEDDVVAFLSAGDRAEKVRRYLRELSAHDVQAREELVMEIRNLEQHLEHVKSIVGKQQAYARTVAVTEECSLPHLLDEALALASASGERRDVTLERDFAALGTVLVDRHKVLQILVNLTSNAIQAVDDRGGADKRVVLRVCAGDAETFQIHVQDNGIGIKEEHRSRVFTHGFTTKPSGHGFGLHTSAIAAQEMGGSLRCESDGHGKGATFVLELPRRPRGAASSGRPS